jgi:hypothetical protein
LEGQQRASTAASDGRQFISAGRQFSAQGVKVTLGRQYVFRSKHITVPLAQTSGVGIKEDSLIFSYIVVKLG